MKMCATSLTSSIMITPTTRRTTFIVLAGRVVLVPLARPSPCSLLIVRCDSHFPFSLLPRILTIFSADAKQARDLVSVLQEAKQTIDPRLAEMVRYGGGGGHGRFGGYRGRGGYRGGGHRGMF